VDSKLFVSIVMPALNEERYIAKAIESVRPRSDDIDWELLVADGGSEDGTCAIVERIAASDPRVRLLRNERRIQAAGVNLGARQADPRARCLVRADCHAEYPAEFVEHCVRTLASTGVAAVVVPMRTRGTTCMQKAIAAAQNSKLGNGGAAHRVAGRSGLVDHGHHAAIDLRTFLELGGYDESFTHNEDAEFDRRLTGAGKLIYLDAGAMLTYYPRTDLVSLARQYLKFGRGRAGTLIKHRARPRLRQLLPVIAFLACLLSVGLAAVVDASFLGIAAAYVLACLGWGALLAVREKDACLLASGVAALTMHMSWAVGFFMACAAPVVSKGRAGAYPDAGSRSAEP
jgi:succinoglycan biosynthesis protein ExoA